MSWPLLSPLFIGPPAVAPISNQSSDVSTRPPPPPPPEEPSLLTSWRGQPKPPPLIAKPIGGTTDTSLPWPLLIWGGLALCSFAALGMLWWRIQQRKLTPAESPALNEKASRAPLVLEPPREPKSLPFLSSREVTRLADAIGQVVDPERPPRLDVPESIRATARSAGLPRVKFRPHQRLKRLLFLVEQPEHP